MIVVHPSDERTRFLNKSYELAPMAVVCINGTMPIGTLRKWAMNRAKFVAIGYGDGKGLFRTDGRGYLLGEHSLDLFEGKDLILFWAGSSGFCGLHGLMGLSLKDWVFDDVDAKRVGLPFRPEDLEEASELLAKVLERYVQAGAWDFFNGLKHEYLSETNPVILYNREQVVYKGLTNGAF